MLRITSTWSKSCAICLLVAFTVSIVGCSDSSSSLSSQDQAKQALDNGYRFLIQGSYDEALHQVISSIELYPTQEAFLLKPQIECLMGKKNDAYSSLDEFAKRYPSDGEDDFIKAIFMSREERDPQEILDLLLIARNDNFVGMEEAFWWEFVENEPSFEYFRDQPEYLDLLELKDLYTDVVTGCKQNITAFKAHWWGPQIYIAHKKMDVFDNIEDLIEVLAELSALLSPAVAALVGAALLARKAEILAKDNGCGVVISWTWANFVPGNWALIIAFWVSSQK
jgi:tetratricopeptide (TPR) repeat protein